MSLSSISIRRPVLATVLSIVIVIFGVIGFQQLGVREYPSVDPPIISVSTSYSGAAAEVMESQITEPLEASVNAVSGIRSLTSISREGRSTLRVEFELEVDLETAANDVRDRVAQAMRDLPPDVDPPVVTKADADSQPIVFLSVRSTKRDLLELSDIAERVFQARFETIPGVSQADIWGQKRYAMRLYLDRARMAAHGLTLVDIRDALNRANVELPAGRVEGDTLELPVRTLSRLATPEEFNNVVIRQQDVRTIRMQDIGRAALAPENERSILKRDGIPSVGVVLRPQPGANQIAITDEFYRRLEQLKPTLPPDLELAIGFDTTQFIRASIREVRRTILIAVGLVVLIIFVFLRDWRATFIPAIVIPISLIGTCFMLYLMGFSINVLTLLAMVLAIGLVVDDAIVVLENIFSKMEDGLERNEAGRTGTDEIFFAVIATTLALIAVFLPILFLGGFTGKLLREFGVALATAVAISSFVALTLTPMLSTRLLRVHKHGRFYNWSEKIFVRVNETYSRALAGFLRRRWMALAIVAVAGLVMTLLFRGLPSELAPLEDRNGMRMMVRAQEGATFDYMARVMDELTQLVLREVPETAAAVTVTSPGFGGGGGINSGFVRHVLTDASERQRTQREIAAQMSQLTRNFGGGRVIVSQEQTLSQGGASAPVQFVLQAPTLQRLREELPGFMEDAEASPKFGRVDVNLLFNKPEVQVELQRERAHALGVSALDIAQTLNLALSEQRLGFFLREGRQYQVIAQLVREDRAASTDLRQLTVPGTDRQAVRLDNLVTFKETVNPPQLFRFNRYIAATVSAELAEGVTLGEGIAEMQRIADARLGEDFRTDLAGLSRDFRESGSSLAFVFMIALVLVFLVLAAQFESFRDPATILLTVPLALTGALLAMWIFGQTMNVFSQIGLIMLIGLVTKNGILIVEFANQRKAAGYSKLDAVAGAAEARFRPVLMTALSTVLGILPLALSSGAGSESRVSLGVAVVGGMFFGTMLTLFVIPAIYSFISAETVTAGEPHRPRRRKPQPEPEPEPEPSEALA
ncbi:MAG: efflux RND transporter permease subunit [Chthoniobacterales bacterium]|nr:efflux RND transporter permease subunit [Chthoniobacterales bacterium]